MVAGHSNAEEIKKAKRKARKLSPEQKQQLIKQKAAMKKKGAQSPKNSMPLAPARKGLLDKTVAIPELQREDFVAPRPSRPAVIDFGKTAVIPNLSEEPIIKAAMYRPGADKAAPIPKQEKVEKAVTMVMTKAEFQKVRRIEQFKQQKSSHLVWWIIVALVVILVLIFMALK